MIGIKHPWNISVEIKFAVVKFSVMDKQRKNFDSKNFQDYGI